MKAVKLSELKGEGVITGFTKNGDFRRRLISIGIYPGAKVRVIRRGLMGTPIEICVGNTRVAIREESARYVIVSLENGD